MIALIKGRLAAKQPNAVIIETGGIGYELSVPLSTFYDLGEEGSEVTLRVHTHVREDTLQLYGFRTEGEKKLFMLLLGVTGIGPKLAITVLSGLGADELIDALRTGNLPRLVGIPGVGRKTAERMLLELKEKAAAMAVTAGSDKSGGEVAAGPGGQADRVESMRDDLLSALLNLGYQKSVAEKAVNSVIRENPEGSFNNILKQTLRKLAI